jgi:integrase
MRKGKPFEIKAKNRKSYRFCDLVSSHCMRRTAVTTLLRLGLEENLVRKISGHAPGSKEFYKYVQLSQSYMDEELEKIYFRLNARNLNLQHQLIEGQTPL